MRDRARRPAARSGTEAGGPEFVVYSHVVLDDIRFADGSAVRGQLGGAGTYAAAGAALASRHGAVAIVSGIGHDLGRQAHQWLRDVGIMTEGLVVTDPLTPRTSVTYFSEGVRDERPVYGREHFDRAEPQFALQPDALSSAHGLYAFKTLDPVFWPELRRRRKEQQLTVVWEIDVAVCTPEHRGAIRQVLRDVDIVSINEAEVSSLFADGAVADPQAWFLDGGTGAVSVRRGGNGATLRTATGTWAATPPIGWPMIDATGAGNSFSGALLAAAHDLMERPAKVLARAMAAAAFAIKQYGPPRIDACARQEFAGLALAIEGAVTGPPRHGGTA